MNGSTGKQRAWLIDVSFFILAFLGLAALILVVNVMTNTWNGVSGHALATVLAGLMLSKYRWNSLVPNRFIVVAFSAVAGFSAIIYLYLLQIFSRLSPVLSFELLKGYELLIAFVVNALVFAATMWFRQRMSPPA